MCLLIDNLFQIVDFDIEFYLTTIFLLLCVTQFLLKKTLTSRKCINSQIIYLPKWQLSASLKEDRKSIKERTKNSLRFILINRSKSRDKKRESMVANADKRATRINRYKRERVEGGEIPYQSSVQFVIPPRDFESI